MLTSHKKPLKTEKKGVNPVTQYTSKYTVKILSAIICLIVYCCDRGLVIWAVQLIKVK